MFQPLLCLLAVAPPAHSSLSCRTDQRQAIIQFCSRLSSVILYPFVSSSVSISFIFPLCFQPLSPSPAGRTQPSVRTHKNKTSYTRSLRSDSCPSERKGVFFYYLPYQATATVPITPNIGSLTPSSAYAGHLLKAVGQVKGPLGLRQELSLCRFLSGCRPLWPRVAHT